MGGTVRSMYMDIRERKTLDGKTLSNADFKNHPATVLNFVAPNCGYCKRALPNVEKVRHRSGTCSWRADDVDRDLAVDDLEGRRKTEAARDALRRGLSARRRNAVGNRGDQVR